jgi:ATP-binding protein involved in chromosome partitioning
MESTATKTVPLRFGPLKWAQAHARLTGPCGDTMEFWVRLRKGRIDKVHFITDGCNNSLLCADAVARLAKGCEPQQIEDFQEKDVLASTSSRVASKDIHCATLAIAGLQGALRHYAESQKATHPIQDSKNNPNIPEIKTRPAPKILLVLSGKGGVGKSTMALHTARQMQQAGYKVGLLDADIHGPSIPKLLGKIHTTHTMDAQGLRPILCEGIQVVSTGFLFAQPDLAIAWRGPRKDAILRQFLENTQWGELDILVVDAPPGTGEEVMVFAQGIHQANGVLLVTGPQDLAAVDVMRTWNFCTDQGLKVLGLIENMSGYACPACQQLSTPFPMGLGHRLSKEIAIPVSIRIPLHGEISLQSDTGCPPNPETNPLSRAFGPIQSHLEHWMLQ